MALDALSIIYPRGQGVPREDAEAVRWYRKSAELRGLFPGESEDALN
jgi:TPR repeat protein